MPVATRHIGNNILKRFSLCVSIERRATGGSYVDGNYVSAGVTETLTDVFVSVQQMTRDELLLLPEGLRTREVKKMYSKTQLFGVNAPDGREADRVSYNNEVYEIHEVGDWKDNGSYCKVVAVKMGQ